jgi:hypothetical protein
MEIANPQRRYRLASRRFASTWRVLWLLVGGGIAAALATAAIAAMEQAGAAGAAHNARVFGEAALRVGRYAGHGDPGYATLALLGTVVVWAPFLLLEVVAHEMGHVLAGRLVGFRFVFCTIGPLKFTSTGRGLVLGYNANWMKVAGSAASVPVHPRHARRRELMRIAGGPLASLLLGSAALALASSNSGMAHRLFELGAITSLFSFGANMLPFRSGGSLSDGARIKMLLGRSQPANRYCAIVALVGASKQGQRPRDWNPEWVARATEVADGSLDDIAGNHLAYYSAVDKGDLQGASLYLRHALAASEGAHVPPRVRWIIQVDAAFFHAYFRKDLATARALLQAAGTSMATYDRFMALRAESAMLLVEGKSSEAQATANEGLEAMDRERLGETGWQMEREWLRELAAASAPMPSQI